MIGLAGSSSPLLDVNLGGEAAFALASPAERSIHRFSCLKMSISRRDVIRKLFVCDIVVAGILCVNATFSHARTVNQAQIDDLEFTQKNYVMKSKAFLPADRNKALAFIDGLEKRPGSLSNKEFLLAVMQIAAFARNGHDSFDDADGWIPSTRLPFRMIWFPDGIIIARAAPEQSELLGAKVEKIEDLPPDELLARLRPLCGASDGYLKWDLNWIIESGRMLHALGVAQRGDQLRFDLTLKDGRNAKRTVAFVSRADVPHGVRPVRFCSPELFPGEAEHGWQVAANVAGEPLYLQQGDEFFRMSQLTELDALYVQFRANSTADAQGHEIAPFVKRVRDEIEMTHPNNLILDLRFDIGGNIDETRDLACAMAANVRGRIYVLIEPYTFSAGIVMAAATKHDGGDRVTIVGDNVGDRLRWSSEGKTVCLPNSRYCLHVTTGLWDLLHGCAGDPDCYGDKLDARVDSLEPQLRVPLTAAAWLAGRDKGMEAIKADLAAH